MSKRKRHDCAECGKEARVSVEDGKWLCTAHINERINAPWNVALMEQDEAEELEAVVLAIVKAFVPGPECEAVDTVFTHDGVEYLLRYPPHPRRRGAVGRQRH